LGSIQPEAVACLSTNKSHLIILEPEPGAQYRRRRDLTNLIDVNEEQGGGEEGVLDLETIDEDINPDEIATISEGSKILRRVRRKIPKLPKGITPYKINDLYINYDETRMKGWVSPTYSNLVFKKDDVTKVRFYLVLISLSLSIVRISRNFIFLTVLYFT